MENIPRLAYIEESDTVKDMSMPEKIPLAIVGCGGIGRRHLYGLAELQGAELSLLTPSET